MNGEYPWSPGGLALLETIQGIVESNGGANEMYYKVLTEITETPYMKHRFQLRHNVRELKRCKVRSSVIMDVMGLTKNQLSIIIKELQSGE